VAERIRKSIEREKFHFGGNTTQITISIGVAAYPDHGQDINGLVGRADAALYKAKESGRNRVLLAT